MTFTKNEDNTLLVSTSGHLLSFKLYDRIVEVDGLFYMIGTPLDNLEYYPSGEDSVIIFRYDKEHNQITGMEDDFATSAEVMNEFQNNF